MLNNYLSDFRILKKYINHNNHIFKKNEYKNQIFLVEFNGWQGIQIAFSYLINFFSQNKKCKIIAFNSYNLFEHNEESLLNKIKWNIGKFFKIKNFGIYASFGVSDFIKPKYDSSIKNRSLKKVKQFYKKEKKLKDLESFCLENIWIGDLIYDSYLKKYLVKTIDLNCNNFKNFFFVCLCNFYYWHNYFKKQKIKGIVVAHSVYVSGIPSRIAEYKNILNFSFEGSNLVNGTNKTSYKKRENTSGIHFRYYRKLFKNFKKPQANINIALGQKYLKELIEGKRKYHYLKKTAFFKKKNSINHFKSYKKKIKVIIYPHLFTDSPHVYGNHFFPDFYEWFMFLEKIVKKTDYDWYLKPHPQEDHLTKKIIDLFIKKNPSVKLLPRNLSNSYIASKKIDFALTVYGTIASELSAYGVKVINASKNNPHFNYNFCINPKDVTEYKKILLNLKKNNFKINKQDLFEFHYMKKHYSDFDSYLFTDPEKYFRYYKNRQIFLTNKCYKLWLEDFSLKRHKDIIKMLENFIKSGDYMITNTHL